MGWYKDIIMEKYGRIAQRYKEWKEEGKDYMINDSTLRMVAEGGYISNTGDVNNKKEGSKPYYDYLKYNDKYKGDGSDMYLLDTDKELARLYKECKEKRLDYLIDDEMLRMIAEGAYASVNGTYKGAKKGYKPYFDYLKYGIKPDQYQEEVKEEPIMIEDNNYNNYETQYSFEYEPYFSNNNTYSITFDHEVDTSNSIQMIEELYNEDNNIEEDIDSNDVINIMDILTNKVKEVKKTIIHYISNYRPIMNKYTGLIGAILIE